MNHEPIRPVDLAARHLQAQEEVEAHVLEVLRSGHYIGGTKVAKAESLVAEWLGTEDAVGVASGTDALILSLQAVGVQAGDEVILPALTFFATAGAVCALGAVPVVVDVLDDGTMNPNAAKAAQTSQTRAVIPVHLFGNIAQRPNVDVPVIDDAAQAIGSTPSPATGQLTAVSTYPTKTWGAAGDGGFVAGSVELVQRVRSLGNHGITGPHQHGRVQGWVGRNSRLDALQAAVLLGHAAYLTGRIARRKQLAARYDAHLPAHISPLPRQIGSAVHQYVVRVGNRDEALRSMQSVNIHASVYYPCTLVNQPALSQSPHRPTPVAEALCQSLLALPIHAGLTDSDVDRVCAALAGRS